MSNPTANPLGAGGDTTIAATKIREILNTEPESQPEESEAPVEANQPETTPGESRQRDESGRFVKAEPEAAEQSETEEDPVQEEEGTAEQSEPNEESEELADSVEGLAEQLGIEADELLDHIGATVKINGDESRVTLRDLKNGYQMEGDYRRKTAEAAEQRRTIESEQRQIEEQRNHFSSQLTPLVSQLESMVGTDDAALQQILNEGDMLGYEQHRIQAEQRKVHLNMAKQEQAKIQQEQQDASRKKLQDEVAENERILAERRPAWAKDPETGRKQVASIRQYLKDEGVPADTANSLYDANSIIIAEKAMLYDKLQKEKPGVLKKVRAVPRRVIKPGTAKPAEDAKKKQLRVNLKSLRQSGDYRDAAKVFKSMGVV